MTRLFLTISRDSKTVPYPPKSRNHGHQGNAGFVDLKGNRDAISRIQEATGDAALTSALTSLNDPVSPFFTIGCEHATALDEGGHVKRGYLELAFNCSRLVRNPTNYFILFLGFDRWMHDAKVEWPVDYHWELMSVHFSRPSVDGWTLTVWLTTSPNAGDREGIVKLWADAMATQVSFLRGSAPPIEDPIYP